MKDFFLLYRIQELIRVGFLKTFLNILEKFQTGKNPARILNTFDFLH